ncbi:MAG TPA: signal recognition particle-docking protein FtsY [Magnetospirillaceae bacterium]|nr:signal recognition particle-docking protein FtsY [Magnetospirillaceae bacterium]
MAVRFSDRLKALLGLGPGDEFFDNLEDLLIEGDVGTLASLDAVAELKTLCRREGILGETGVRVALRRILARYGREARIEPAGGGLDVILVLGVNGVGKTTTVAKLGHWYRVRGLARKVILAAGDTFRAAAIDQLRVHGERLGMRVVAQQTGSDPGAVLYDAIEAAKAEGADLVLADTAGRMHNRQNLVRELEKIDRIIGARIQPSRYWKLLVVDGTTGQNALRQAEAFGEAIKLDGAVLSKYDSSGKGGVVISLAYERKLPTIFLGTGEGYEDIRPFRLDQFLDEFLGMPG